MERLLSPQLAKIIFVFLASIAALSAQVSVTWTGLGYYDGTDVAANWQGNVLPLNDGTEEFIFGDSARHEVTFYTDVNARKLSITGITRPYHLDDDYGDLTIGAGGLVYAPAVPLYSVIGAYTVYVNQNQIWNIQSGGLAFEYYIYGSGQITKTGAGMLIFEETYNQNWTGGLVLKEGQVGIGPGASTSLGTGPLVFDGGTLVASDMFGYYWNDGEVRVGNPIFSKGFIKTVNDEELSLEGPVTLEANTTIQSIGEALFIDGAVSETGGARKLTINAENAVILSGSNSWTGGTEVTKGVLIFGGLNNLPVTGAITVGSDGYVGIGKYNPVAGFIGMISPTSTGTIGFDSDLWVSLDHFAEPIDLSAKNDTLRIGTATGAVLDPAAVITPFASTYRFGGGGGTLAVASPLTDPATGTRNLDVSSPAELPLTVRLMNTTNTLSGTVSVSNSALIFGDNVPLPAGTYTMNHSSYIGTEDPDVTPASFLTHFAATTQGTIGFDIGPDVTTTREITNLNLSGFTGGVYVGTASALYDSNGDISGPGLRLTGTLTPGTDGNFRFTGYKGGALEVASALSGASAQVYIGEPNTLGTMGDPKKDEYSTVLLSGANTHGGNTTLYAGRLLLGDENALGPTGALVVQPHNITLPGEDSSDIYAQLGAYIPTTEVTVQTVGSIFTVNNPIQLNASLGIGDHDALKLAGVISGPGGLELEEDAYLALAGTNTFSGGVYLRPYSQLTIASDQATGTGVLGFGGGSYSDVYIDTTAPVIHGLGSREESDYATIHFEQNQTVLTIMQPEGLDTKFAGNIHSDFYSVTEGYGTAKFVKDGAGTLRFYGDMSFDGILDATREATISAEIRAGTLIVSGDSYYGEGYAMQSFEYGSYVELGYDKVLLKGGTLAVDNNTTLGNDIIAEAGRLAGFGRFEGNVAIGDGAILSPGLDGARTGLMSFKHLELDGGGIFEFNVLDPDPSNPLGQDRIDVYGLSTLVINATAGDPFTIRVISLDPTGNPGTLAGVSQDHGIYSWVLFDYTALSIPALEDTFNPNLFSLDIDGFSSDAPLGGSFTLFQEGNHLLLGFTPVPEPSTYALMALGLSLVGWTVWRRRRQG